MEKSWNENPQGTGTGRRIIQGILVDVTRTGVARVECFEDELHTIYNLLDVEYIDVATRSVGGKVYDFIVDDEGLLKSPCIPSVFGKDERPMLVGNVLIVNSNEMGEFTSLTEEDVENLEQHLGRITFYDEEKQVERAAIVIKDAEYC